MRLDKDTDTLVHEYKCRWKRGGPKQSWEPAENLTVGCQDSVDRYEELKRENKKRESESKKSQTGVRQAYHEIIEGKTPADVNKNWKKYWDEAVVKESLKSSSRSKRRCKA